MRICKLLIAMTLVTGGCTHSPRPVTAPSIAAAGDNLPAGAGKQILQSSCTSCHDLREVTKFRGFYTRAQWRDIVGTMVDYGAMVGEKDREVLADYLAANLGRR